MALNPASPGALTPARAVSELCPHCGFCCNGVLFADVRIPDPSEAATLRKLDVPLRGQPGRWRLPQPCPCFDGQLCSVYALRPERCRTFSCGLLQRLIQGRLSPDQARAIVQRARAALAKVEQALAALGQATANRPLQHRVTHALARPLDLSRPGVIPARQRLMRAMEQLHRILAVEFLTPEGAKAPERPARHPQKD